MWNGGYDWSQEGDEWSAGWGGPSYQWWTTLFPRIHGYVPADRILEIAPGYGRWTHYLRDLCSELIIVDIAETAIAHCGERFAADRHISGYVNDGRSLPMVASDSIDFVFSFDSLVHAEIDVMSAYLTELARIMAADGVAFLHHSNVRSYEPGTYDPHNIHWRAMSVSGALIEQLARSANLSCVSQEAINWGNETKLIDCLSVITRAGSRWDRENVVVENPDFAGVEKPMALRLSKQYPPSRREVRFGGVSPRTTAHVHALELFEQGEPERARRMLSDQLRLVIDPEALNDLAVLANQCGDDAEARDLLRALVRLHPEHAAAAANLEALDTSA